MSGNLPKRPRLLIVSDTAMYAVKGELYAFEPVVREIEHFAFLFSHITWIGYLYPGTPPANARKVNPEISITYIPLKACGGPGFRDKLEVLWRAPGIGLAVWKALRNSEVVHSRAPSMPAFWAILFSAIDRSRRYWHKYAGDWSSEKVPLFYGLQRQMLQLIPHVKVTMNGNFQPDKPHCLSWLNPCISNSELEQAHAVTVSKDYDSALTICFVGQIIQSKGIIQLIQALGSLPHGMIQRVFIAGDGPLLQSAITTAASLGLRQVEFVGNLPRRELEAIYQKAHILVLPSASEGLPKVVPEACAFGCVPVVASIPALLPLFKGEMQHLVLKNRSPESIASAIAKLAGDRQMLRRLANDCVSFAGAFTYERYAERIQQEILNENL
jgi:glycosyltransferase involved in cell wall biosynthesis